MAMLMMAEEMKPSSWAKHIRRLAPEIEFRVWPETGNVADIRMALVWKPPEGALTRFPNLGCIASLGVGVDHILNGGQLPENIPITRIVDPSMARSMSEYITLAVLNHCRHFDRYRQDQQDKTWQPRVPLLPDNIRIGLMGMGQLGSHAAMQLRRFGFAVAGWSRTPKEIAGIGSYVGSDGLLPFVRRTDILICTLPLTPSTEGILGRRIFEHLPQGAYLINVARGQHLVEADLISALAQGRLSGACLDVFCEEPLPESHPFWRHPRITVTPHISSLTYPAAVAPQLVENYRRLESGQPLENVVDPERGY
jgi:glyoxylate/hydroxypyruvate reductase A